MKKFFTLLCASILGVASFAQDAYDASAHTCFVSGSANMFAAKANGDGWAGTDEMTYDEASKVWTITMQAKKANEVIEFKVVYDSEWYGNEGNNVQFQVSEISDVTITFDPESFAITYKGDKVEAYDPNKIDYITAVGSAKLLNDQDWKVDAEINRMTKEDEGYYTFSVKGVEAGNYNIKFAANGAWAKQWGASSVTALENGVALAAAGGSNPANFDLVLAKGYTYDVDFVLDFMDADNPTVTATWKEAGSAEIKDDVYSVAGNMNGWDQKDVATEMTKTADGIYSYTFVGLAAGDYQYKVVTNHDWNPGYGASAAGQEGDDAWFSLTDASDVTITINFNGDSPVITVTISESTGINAVEVSSKQMGIYNIAGQRVSKATRGLYIINGKKVLK